MSSTESAFWMFTSHGFSCNGSSLHTSLRVPLWGLHMTDVAFIRLPDGSAWLGEGPFEDLAERPVSGGAFYVNDFDLSDVRPWKRPSRLSQVSADEVRARFGSAGPMRIAWEKPATEWFKMAFRRIRREVLSGRLDKMVPVLTETGKWVDGIPEQLLASLMEAPGNLWCYGRLHAGRGFLGATPELLFHSNAKALETMALAGTAKPGAQADFLSDVKEISEHELVVDYLRERLAKIGTVTREPRGLCETSGLMHFQTWMKVQLDDPAEPEALVRWLHPTPAVGCLPRREEWLAKLREYRAMLNVPGFFGAPFGFASGDECHMVVAIRGIAWDGSRVMLPSGCGIVGGSAFDHEWRELRLKREAVLRLLAL